MFNCIQLGNYFFIQDFIKDLDSHQEEFLTFKNSGKYEGQVLPRSQLEDMGRRFEKVAVQLKLAEKQYLYEELLFGLLAFLVDVEKKRSSWSIEYGRLEHMEGLLHQYQVLGYCDHEMIQYQIYCSCNKIQFCM